MSTKIVCCICVIGMIMASCHSFSEPDIPTQELILSLEALPETWEIVPGAPLPMGTNVGFGDEEDTQIIFKLKTDKHNISAHYVLHYNNHRQAEEGYAKLSRSHFNDNSIAVNEPWQTPLELSYTSTYASQFRQACTINNVAGSRQVCELMAQYKNYVTIFHSVIKPDTMSLEEFNQVAQFIDEMMVSKLKLDQVEQLD